MKQFEESIKAAARSQSLTTEERAALRMRLNDAMRTSPAYTHAPLFALPVRSPFVLSGFSIRTAYAFAALMLIVVLTGGTAYAAEGALPGDALYAVKVNVNEPVVGALAFSDSAKATWNADVATERLKEAAALAAKGQLTASTSVELADAFNQHASQAAAITSQLATQNPSAASELAINFSTTVATQSNAILVASGQSESTTTIQASSDLVRSVIATKIQESGDTLAMADQSETTTEVESVRPATQTPEVSTVSKKDSEGVSSETEGTVTTDSAIANTLMVAANTVATINSTSSEEMDVSNKPMMVATVAPSSTGPREAKMVAPMMAVSVSAPSAAVSVTVETPTPPDETATTSADTLATELAAATQHAQDLLNAHKGNLSASTTAYIAGQIANLQLIPIQIQADVSANDPDAAMHDAHAGIMRAAHISGFIQGQVNRRPPHGDSADAGVL